MNTLNKIADFWYRHESDTDRTMRLCPQMTCNCASIEGAIAEADSLHKSGYEVQRVVVRTLCTACEGAGRIASAPKGTRKAKIASLPAWMLTYRECPKCHGIGSTDEQELYVRS